MILFRKRNTIPSPDIQLRFLKQLSYLLTNGYSLLRALDVLSWEKTYQTIAKSIQAHLKSGKHIDEAFDELTFDHSISSYLYFVRLHGDLPTHISSCAKMFERKKTYETTFKRAIRYPLFLSGFFGVLFVCIKQFVLPSFDSMISSNGSSTAAHLILKVINGSFLFGGFMIVSISILVLLWKIQKSSISVDRRMELYERIPLYRSYVRLSTSHQLATHMATLFQSGLTIKQTLMYLEKQTKLPILSHYAHLIQNDLHAGIQLSDIFENFYFIDAHLGQIFQSNKDQPSIETDLTMYAQIVTEELHRKAMQLITIIQPMFFGVIALFIISMYIALMWPMFQMIQTI